jgi:hypothetical protein
MSINNAFPGKNMGENESEIKMNDIIDRLADLSSDMNTILDVVRFLEERVIRMERSYDALGRRLEGSERHVEDEGWFD